LAAAGDAVIASAIGIGFGFDVKRSVGPVDGGHAAAHHRATSYLQRYQTDSTPWQNYTLYGAGGGMAFSFADPLFKSQMPWTISLFANVQWWYYDQPDAVVDPTVTRQQTDTILNITLSVPFDQRTMFTVSGGRFVRSADIPNYAFTNNSALIGVTWRF
jgi:hypothetical protein